MIMYGIFNIDEDEYFDFDEECPTYNFKPSVLLPTFDMAQSFHELYAMSDRDLIIEYDIRKVENGEIVLYTSKMVSE
jgi:hypothetical protein